MKKPQGRESIKVTPAFLRGLKNEQNRLLNETGTEPTYLELLEEAWGAYKRRGTIHRTFPRKGGVSQAGVITLQSEAVLPRTPEETEAVSGLLHILRSGDAATATAILHNLDRFALLARIFDEGCELPPEAEKYLRKGVARMARDAKLHGLPAPPPLHLRGASEEDDAEDSGSDEGDEGKGE